MKKVAFWPWLWVVLGGLYFLLPLYATLDFSLRAKRGVLGLTAYASVLHNPKFVQTFAFSLRMAVFTIVVSILLMVPTVYWVHLRVPRLRPMVEFVTLLPFVVPAIVHVFGLIKTYSQPPLVLVVSPALLVGAYVVLSFPYMYRAIDTGLRALDVRTLTEAAQSLGAGWGTILFRVILPNLRVALLSGAFLTFSIVMGELTLALYLAWPAFGPFMYQIGQNRAYEPAALAIISLALTWLSIGLIQLFGRGHAGQAQIAGAK
ncbi:MAG: ABC transporter permease subunit [Herpetosiphonaceae bacterium]|nr:ABC transporter permease subunit [Herpetosiphonaceae bacterium]